MKLNYKRTILIGLAFLSISAFWQMYDNVVPLILKNTFGMGESVSGVVMAADNVLALFLLPLFGTLSDKVDTRIGKRMPFIVGCTALAVTLLMILGYANAAKKFVLFVKKLKVKLIINSMMLKYVNVVILRLNKIHQSIGKLYKVI